MLGIVIVGLPICVFSFFVTKKIFKKLLCLLAKVDTFEALIKCKREVVYLYKTKIFPLWKRKYKHYQDIPLPTEHKVHEDIVDTIIAPQHDTAPISSDIPSISISEDMTEEQKTTMIKKRKLLEKIIYDALGLRKDGKFDDYEKKIIEWLAIDPEDKDLNKLLADLYFTIGNYKKALPILKKNVEVDPKDHKAIRQIGEIYLSSSQFNVAELLIQKAIGINPTNPKYYISMVELFYNTDRKQDAIAEMEKVIKLRPTNSAYMLTLADLYQELHDLDNAQKYYFRVLEYEPSNEQAKKKLKDLSVE